MEQLYPILEFDPEPVAILQPSGKALPDNHIRRAVLCFFRDVITDLLTQGRLEVIGKLVSEIGDHPIYKLAHQGQDVLVFHPGVGAPLAGGFLDDLTSFGVRSFIACGGCGVLNKEIAAGHPIILTSAVRDEGTSYHYLPPSREVQPSPKGIAALESVFQRRNIPYTLGKAWTTDGFYRETAAKRTLRLAEGCIAVEMEASAFFAVAQFRGVDFGQVVYGGDLVIPEGHEWRSWNERRSDRENLFWLSVEAVLEMKE